MRKLAQYLLIGLIFLKQPIYSLTNQGVDNGPYNPEISVFIQEPIGDDFVYESWSGYIPAVRISTEQMTKYNLNERLRIGVGLLHQYSYQNNLNLERTQIRGIIEYRLW